MVPGLRLSAPAWGPQSQGRPGGGDLGRQHGSVPRTHRGGTGGGQRPRALGGALLGLHADARAQGGATCWGPERAEAELGVGAARRTHVRAAGTRRRESTHRHARAGRRPFPSPRPAPLSSAQREPDPGPSTARRRTGRLGLPRGGAAPYCSSPEAGPPLPWPRAGRGAAAAVERGLAPRLCLPARAAGAPGRWPPPEPLRGRGAMNSGSGDDGRGEDGGSLGMDVTVSELMELFLQSPLVTWVSAPGSPPHC